MDLEPSCWCSWFW